MAPDTPKSRDLHHDAENTDDQDDVEAVNERGFDPRWHGAVINFDKWHFHRRLLERYGVVLGPADYSRMSRSIAAGRAPLISSGEDRTAVYLVRVPSSGALVFVGAKRNGELITAMSVTERLAALAKVSWS